MFPRYLLHIFYKIILFDWGFMCGPLPPHNSYEVLTIIVVLQLSVLAGLWATETGFFTYLFIVVFHAPNPCC
jgi:hypothetical protein